MSVKLEVPSVGESISEVVVLSWLKEEGRRVAKDEPLVTLETDKVTVELPSPVEGILEKILKGPGETVPVGGVLGLIREVQAGEAPEEEEEEEKEEKEEPPLPAKAVPQESPVPPVSPASPASGGSAPRVMPAAERLLAEKGLSPEDVKGTGPGGRILKEDAAAAGAGRASGRRPPKPPLPEPGTEHALSGEKRLEEVVPMTALRKRIAARLLAAQREAALLTTFNEIDMSGVQALRREFKELFLEKHGVKLGLMSFFVKAVIEALKEVPALNAEIRDENIVYRNYYDIGIAVGGGRGLVVPVLRGAERMGFAGIEKKIADFARRAADGKLTLEDLRGGTFTISNGGVYGNLLSTPIVNPPQSGILGLHAIQDRPVAREGRVVIRPMMYVALTYDHRLVDGREAVTFLKRVKHCVENPSRILLEV